MLVNIDNTTNKVWSDFATALILSPYEEYADYYELPQNTKGRVSQPEPNFDRLKDTLNLDLEEWYRRSFGFQVPKYVNGNITLLDSEVDFKLFPSFFNERGRQLTRSDNPIYKLFGFDFELTDFQRTVDNNLIIDFSILNQYWELSLDKQLENNPQEIFFQASYKKPNNTECMISFPNEYDSNNTMNSGDKKEFSWNLSPCNIDEDEIIEIYFGISALPQGEDPTDLNNFTYNQQYLLQFDLEKENQEINLKYRQDQTYSTVIEGENNDTVGDVGNSYDYKKEEYEFELSEELRDPSNKNPIKEVVNIKYVDNKFDKTLILPKKVFMDGEGEYEGMSVELRLEENSRNNFTYVINDKTYFDVYNNQIVKNESHSTYNLEEGLVQKRVKKYNPKSIFKFSIESFGYLNQNFEITVPMNTILKEEVKTEKQANIENLTFKPFEKDEEKSFEIWEWKDHIKSVFKERNK